MLGVISLQTPQGKWDSSRLEGKPTWIFSSCGTCSRLTMGTSGTRSGGFKKCQSVCEFLGGLSGFISRQCRGLRPCVELMPEPEDSCPVLTWMLGYFWSLPRVVRPRLDGGMHVRFPHELKQQCQVSLRVDQGICGFPSRLSHEAFPRGFPTGLYNVPPCCASILGLKVEAVKEKQVSLEWNETSGGLWEWWNDPGVPLAFPVESAPS